MKNIEKEFDKLWGYASKEEIKDFIKETIKGVFEDVEDHLNNQTDCHCSELISLIAKDKYNID